MLLAKLINVKTSILGLLPGEISEGAQSLPLKLLHLININIEDLHFHQDLFVISVHFNNETLSLK